MAPLAANLHRTPNEWLHMVDKGCTNQRSHASSFHPLDFYSPIPSPSWPGHNRRSHQITVIMAAITNSLSRPLPLSKFYRLQQSPSLLNLSSSFLGMPIRRIHATPTRTLKTRARAPAAAASSAAPAGAEKKSKSEDERVQKIHSIEEFDAALQNAKTKLVVVEFAASHSQHSRKIYPFMVELSRTCGDVEFLLVMGDESEATKALCAREKIEKVPHFSFYKSMEKIHEEEGIGPDELMGDVLYYGDSHSAVEQLHSWEDVKKLVEEHKAGKKLIVLDVGLKHCGPCVKVYPTVLKLSKQMRETVVFARLNGDENDSCMAFLKEMEVVEVPTFLFIREGEVRGRYVGSGKGELVGEILRYQGVKVT